MTKVSQVCIKPYYKMQAKQTPPPATHTPTHPHTHSNTHTPTHAPTHTLTPMHPNTHTHAHTHTHTHTHTHHTCCATGVHDGAEVTWVGPHNNGWEVTFTLPMGNILHVLGGGTAHPMHTFYGPEGQQIQGTLMFARV